MQPNSPSKPKGLAPAQVAEAPEIVQYQDGAVVSREIVKKPTGNVTIFAFDEGQGLSEHTAPFDALVQALEGEAEIVKARHGGDVRERHPHAFAGDAFGEMLREDVVVFLQRRP